MTNGPFRAVDGDRVEGWWVGETKFRLKEHPTSVLDPPNTLPSDILAVARAANARVNLCPGDVGIRLPIFRTDQVMAIAFPCWEVGDEGDGSLNEGDCFVFVPAQVGIDLLVEENLPLRRTTYHRATSGYESVMEEGRSPQTSLLTTGILPHSLGLTFRWLVSPDAEHRSLPSHLPSHLSVAGRSIPCVTR